RRVGDSSDGGPPTALRRGRGAPCDARTQASRSGPRFRKRRVGDSSDGGPPTALRRGRGAPCDARTQASRSDQMKLVIATRGSALALWQARHVMERLHAVDTTLEIELSII